MRFVSLALLFLLAACGSTRATVQPINWDVQPAQPTTHQVSYTLDVIGGSDVTMTNATGATEQFFQADDYSLNFQAPTGQHLYLSAQASQLGSVECTIKVNGVVVQTAKAVGNYRIATCSASAK